MLTKILPLIFLFLTVSASAQTYKTDFEEAMRLNIISKILSVSIEKHYGESGRSPRNERELLESCNTFGLNELDPHIENNKQKIKMAKSVDELLKESDSASLEALKENNLETENEILSKGVPFIGYCDVQGDSTKCNSPENCTSAKDVYGKKLKSIISDKNALMGGWKKLCDRIMKARAEAHAEAIQELEMCRLSSENISSKEEKLPLSTPKKNEIRNMAPASLGSPSKTSAQ